MVRCLTTATSASGPGHHSNQHLAFDHCVVRAPDVSILFSISAGLGAQHRPAFCKQGAWHDRVGGLPAARESRELSSRSPTAHTAQTAAYRLCSKPTQRNTIFFAPDKRISRPISARRSSLSVIVSSGLPASCPTLLANRTVPYAISTSVSLIPPG
jgi:hypothetical protein